MTGLLAPWQNMSPQILVSGSFLLLRPQALSPVSCPPSHPLPHFLLSPFPFLILLNTHHCLRVSCLLFSLKHVSCTVFQVYSKVIQLCMYVCVCIYTHRYVKSQSVSCSVVYEYLRPYGLEPSRLLCPWDSPGKNTSPGDLSDPGIEPGSSTLQADFFFYHLIQQQSPCIYIHTYSFSVFSVTGRHTAVNIVPWAVQALAVCPLYGTV